MSGKLMAIVIGLCETKLPHLRDFENYGFSTNCRDSSGEITVYDLSVIHIIGRIQWNFLYYIKIWW